VRRASLRVRLTVLTTLLLAATLAVGATALTTVLRVGRVGALDAIVRERVATVALLVEADGLPATLPVAEPGEVAQVLDAQGRVLASSPTASRTLPVLPAADVARVVVGAGGGAATIVVTSPTGYSSQARVALRAAELAGQPVTVVASVPLREVQGLVRALSVALGVVVPLLTALFAGAVWVVLGRALHPVEHLRRAAGEVAASGGPGSLPVPREAELAALAVTLNAMLDRLDTAASRQRTFVADAAHELRSPLASLRATLDVAALHPQAYEAGELVAGLDAEVRRMQNLVDDLLVLARVGATPAAAAPVNLGSLARTVAALPRPPAAEVTVEGAGSATADARAVERVLRNLVDNAARHAGHRVAVTVADGAVRVDDDGPGIPAADRERVFERFVRLDGAREHAGGTGLGLAIARELAREQGGDVTLTDSPAGGLRAELTLPAP
jgi:signal transduction histidine kinase